MLEVWSFQNKNRTKHRFFESYFEENILTNDFPWKIIRLTLFLHENGQFWKWTLRKVTGVKKVIFTENASTPRDYIAWPYESFMWISLSPSNSCFKLQPGSFWGHRGENVIFTKHTLTCPYKYFYIYIYPCPLDPPFYMLKILWIVIKPNI